MTLQSQLPPKFSLYQSITDQIVKFLEQGIIPWRKQWSNAGPPTNAISKHPFTGINLWLLMGLSYERNLYLTFDQTKKVGGSVKRGEQGHIVTSWILWDKGDGNEEAEIPFLRYYKVFNIDQCTGIPVSVREPYYEWDLLPVAACEDIVQSMPNRPEIRFDKPRPFYHRTEDYINMPCMKHFPYNEAYYSVLFHEMIHSTGHESRLARRSVTDMSEFCSAPYSFEELIAELGSCYLCSHAGIGQKVLRDSAAYIQGWLTQLQNNYTYIVLASSQAQRAVNYILNKQNECPIHDRLSEIRA